MSLGKRLKEARERAGLSQEQLGELVGMSQQAIGLIETGDTKQPRKIDLIAKHLGVSPEWLLYGSDDLTAEAVKIALMWQAAPEAIKMSIKLILEAHT